MIINANCNFSELFPKFDTGIWKVITKSDQLHDVFIMNRDDYFNKSEIDYSKAIVSKIGVLNSYIEYYSYGPSIVFVVKNPHSRPLNVCISLEHN